jgi:hypothetical protein
MAGDSATILNRQVVGSIPAGSTIHNKPHSCR